MDGRVCGGLWSYGLGLWSYGLGLWSYGLGLWSYGLGLCCGYFRLVGKEKDGSQHALKCNREVSPHVA